MKKYRIRKGSPIWWAGVVITIAMWVFVLYGAVAIGADI